MRPTLKVTERKKAVVALCFLLLALLLLVPAIQNILISAGGTILGRTLNHPDLWVRKIQKAGLYAMCVPLFCFFHSLGPLLSKAASGRKYNAMLYAALFLTAFATSTLFSLFPLGLQVPYTDSAIFIYIGRMMHLGKIPYKDMFDHKGIVLYFIEYLGAFTKGYTGVYLMELASMFATVVFIYKAARLVSKNEPTGILTAFLVTYILGKGLFGGANCSEEYALPCIAFSNYVFLKYLRTGECKLRDFFFVGLTFTAVLMIRVNMVAPWAFYVPYFLATLVKDKKYQDMRTMIIGFACGMLAVLLPSMAYFLSTSSLRDMWEAYILFNFKYISDKGGTQNVLAVIRMFIRIFALPCLCMLASLLQQRKDKCHLINAAVFAVTLLSVSISGRDYPHYGITLLPIFALPIAYVLESLRSNLQDRADKTTACAARLFLTLIALIPLLSLPVPIGTGKVWHDSIVKYLKEETAPDSDVLVFANEAMYYVASERYTKQRFLYQEPVIRQHPLMIEAFTNDLASNPPDYIVLQNHRTEWLGNPAFSGIRELLDSTYEKKNFPEGYVYIKGE